MKDCTEIRQKLGGSETCYSNKHSVKEQGKSFTISSKDEAMVLCCIKLDKCLIPQLKDQKQCDYLFVRTTSNGFDYYFVELKGSAKEADYAYKQIVKAIDFVKKKVPQIPKSSIYGIIVGGSDTQAMSRLKEQFKKNTGVSLKHNTGSRCEYPIL